MKKLMPLLIIQKMNSWEKIQKRELMILTIGLCMPLLVMGMILFNENKTERANNLVPAKVDEYKFEADINAQSAMVTELNTGKILFAKNEKEQKPIASLTKLMTTLVALEKFNENSISRVQINEDHLRAFGDSGLQVGQIWNVKDLIDFTLITSSNDGARALALSAFGEKTSDFVLKMNSLSNKLGLANTFFANETGLDIDSDQEAGAISSAEDITKILQFITLHQLDNFTASTNFHKNFIVDGQIYDVENTNKSVDKIPGLLVSKTGYTDIAGGNLAVVADIGLNNPVSIVILGSTLEERENDVNKLIEETLNYYSDNITNYDD